MVPAVSDRCVNSTGFDHGLVRYVSRVGSGIVIGAITLSLVTPRLADCVPAVAPIAVVIVAPITVVVAPITVVVTKVSVVVTKVSVVAKIAVVVSKIAILLLSLIHRLANASQNPQCGTIATKKATLSVSYAGHQRNTTQQNRRSNNHFTLSKKLPLGIRAIKNHPDFYSSSELLPSDI